MWLMRMDRLSGLMRAISGDLEKKYSGLLMMNWSRGELVATRTAADRPGLPPRPPGPLPGAGDRPGVAGQHRDVERPDVDAELEGVGRDDAQDLARPQALLDLPPLERQVAAAVAADEALFLDRRLDVLFEVGQQDLGDEAAAGEDDRLEAVLEEDRGDAPRLVDVGPADAERGVDDRRRVEDEILAAARRAVVVDERDRRLDHLLGHLGRVGDRRRAEDELRVGAVEPGDPPQPPQDVGQVAAEDAAVVVELVDDDVLEVLEQLDPLGVVRQDPGVEHVGVRQDDVAAGPDGPAGVLGRVAVVGEDADLLRQPPVDVVELGLLVLGQGLGREEVQGPRRRVLHDGVEDRQVVAERLARRGRRHDDDVLALLERLPGRALVGVEPGEPLGLERGAQGRVDVVGVVPERALLGRQVLDGLDGVALVAEVLEQLERPEDLLFVRHGAPSS